MARSALIAPKACEHPRRCFLTGSQLDRLGEIREPAGARRKVAGGSKTLEGATIGERRKHGNRPPAISHLDGFAGLDAPEQLAGPLPQLSYTDPAHVLLVAHPDEPGQHLVALALDERSLPARTARCEG